jgi:hypothetical protein
MQQSSIQIVRVVEKLPENKELLRADATWTATSPESAASRAIPRIRGPALRARRVHVLRKFRGMGVGRTLAGAIVQQAFESAPTLYVHSDRAGGFWERMGFSPISHAKASPTILNASKQHDRGASFSTDGGSMNLAPAILRLVFRYGQAHFALFDGVDIVQRQRVVSADSKSAHQLYFLPEHAVHSADMFAVGADDFHVLADSGGFNHDPNLPADPSIGARGRRA